MFVIFILFEINFIYSLVLTITIIDSLFVSVGEYPEHLDSGVNYLECGVRYVSTCFAIQSNKKCFKNDYPNKTFLDIGVIPIDSSKQRVIFGLTTSSGEAPWAVYLSYTTGANEYNFCSGVLVTFEWIITAAHCYDNRPRTTVTASAGSNHKKGVQQIMIDKSKWFRHPEYFNKSLVESKVRFDVSLVKLKRKFSRIQSENKYLINTICLPSRYQINDEEESATLFGYGVINDLGMIPKNLQRAELHLAPFVQCDSLMICSNYSGFDARTCYGDSGGGLVKFIDRYEARAVLIGTLVGGTPDDSGCSERIEKDFFTTISFFIDWILDTIQNN